MAVIEQANEIITEYMADGYELTVRQLYYQFVARDMFPEDRRWTWTGRRWVKDPNGTKNADPNYKWLGGLINDGRLVGVVDWNSIVDRTRHVVRNTHWDNPSQILQSAANGYSIDTRRDQPTYIEVWVEKESLAGILERACEPMDIPYFCCKGNVSQSAMWRASRRIISQDNDKVVVLYLGDHDPSGMDMSRDVQDRLDLFNADVHVDRIALNLDQIKKLNPPPSPAKVTDSRYAAYVEEFGDDSWELDALDPRTINELITKEANALTDTKKRRALIKEQESQREKLQTIADRYDYLEIE